MHKTNRIFEKILPPPFYLKVACKKKIVGEGVFSRAYSSEINWVKLQSVQLENEIVNCQWLVTLCMCEQKIHCMQVLSISFQC